jgi:hypothetical protein
MSGPLFPTGFCPDIGRHMVHPASAWCPEPRLFGGRDSGLWEWSDFSCHSLVGSFKKEFFLLSEIQLLSQGNGIRATNYAVFCMDQIIVNARSNADLGQHSFVACNPVSMHCFNAITNY